MNKDQIKNAILSRKISIFFIVILLIIVGVLFSQKQEYKYTLLYQYQTIPDIELTNTLSETQRGLAGEIRGFVKFNDPNNQPKDVRQYYVIRPLDKFDENLSQYFSLEDVIKMQYLSPRSLGLSELIEISETLNTITLEDEDGNQFFISKATKEFSVGNEAILITNDFDYKDFMMTWLKK